MTNSVLAGGAVVILLVVLITLIAARFALKPISCFQLALAGRSIGGYCRRPFYNEHSSDQSTQDDGARGLRVICPRP